MFRDSPGGTRIDIDLSSGEEIRFINDVPTSTNFVVDVAKGLYESDTYESTYLGWMFANVDPKFMDEHHKMFGVDCVQVRFKLPRQTPNDGDVGEAWICQSLGIVMEDTNPLENWKWEFCRLSSLSPNQIRSRYRRASDNYHYENSPTPKTLLAAVIFPFSMIFAGVGTE